jgi:hypothetical protein
MISHVNVELKPYILEIFISIIRVNVVNDHACLIYTSLSNLWLLILAYYAAGGKGKKAIPVRSRRPKGLSDVEASIFSRHSVHRWQ